MTVLLFWEEDRKRKQERSGETLAGSLFCQVQARAPGISGLWNRRFWDRLFRSLAREGHRRLICGGQEELTALAARYGLERQSHQPLLRHLAVPLAQFTAEPGLTPVLYSSRADPLTVDTAVGLCDTFSQVALCVGRQSESLAGYLRQELGASPLIGDEGGPRLRIFLEAPGQTVKTEGKCLDLTPGGLGLAGSIRDAILTGPGAEALPASYRTDLVCDLARRDQNYEKFVKIVGIP